MGDRPRSILLCTLGASWAVVPEVYAVVAPDILDLFRHHERRERFRQETLSRGIAPPDEVWVATTGGTEEQRQALLACWNQITDAPPLKIWVARRTHDLGSTEECDEMRELLFRLTFHAAHNGQHQALVLSVAGGRKTMSADLQWAGSVFGARACVHVIDRNLPEPLRRPTPDLFTAPLKPELANSLEPVFFGPLERSDLLDVQTAEFPLLDPEEFPIEGEALPSSSTTAITILWEHRAPSLVDVWRARERARPRIYVGHLKHLLEQEPRPNWYGLYRLSPRHIEALRRHTVGPQLRTWLTALPKADLHCHLGGVLDVAQQREVARVVWDLLSQRERQRALERVKVWYREKEWPANWPNLLGRGRDRLNAATAILCNLSEGELVERLYRTTEPRVGLRAGLGFRAYEIPGELSGSALLQSEPAVREYVRQTYTRLRRDGVCYCELRCSPHKYLCDHTGEGNIGRFLLVFDDALREAQQEDPGLDIRLLIVLDRRRELSLADIKAIIRARRSHQHLIVGVDIAGDESTAPRFGELARLLNPVFRECLPLTIHAGEGESAHNIWQAVYRLHAERVGHGLTLHEHPELAQRLRDRGIAIELCPTSNVEVVGYYDPEVDTTWNRPEYPLRSYLQDLGLDVVLCTDNPGISRTSLADEYLRAARMCGGLNVWQLLALVRAGFEHAFLPAAERSSLLRRYDAEVVEKVTQLLQGTDGTLA
ncbi:MAG: CRISPR-associated ring nuclease [Candidatus Binatia bacterium]|nr:CRISPR-associated ring nuclease [Candidatus Binatia bacterium]